MIYELLSTALLACSLGSSTYRNEPKRSFPTATSLNGTISIQCLHSQTIEPEINLSLNGYTSGWLSGNDQGNQNYAVSDHQDSYFTSQWDFTHLGGEGVIRGAVLLYISDENLYNDIAVNGSDYITYTNGVLDDGILGNDYNGRDYEIELDWYAKISQEVQDYSFDIKINVPAIVTYSVTKSFTNCHWSGNTAYNIPDTYTEATRSNPYTYLVVANTGCYFKTDGSGIVANGGLEIVSIDYGNYPTISHLMYTTEIMLTLNLPLADCSISLTAVTFSVQEINDLYGDGFEDAKAIYGENVQFQWIKTAFDGMAGFFNIQILPNISLGFLMFAPLVVVAIVAIVRIIKHD